jgi:hypothetical protein
MEIEKIEENKENLEILLKKKNFLVPFFGAGFSAGTCPTWSDFLDRYFEAVHLKYLSSKHKKEYLSLKRGVQANKFELRFQGTGQFFPQACRSPGSRVLKFPNFQAPSPSPKFFRIT